ncbi:MAG TPA: FAD-dependent oxidoreductase [Clostridia bacterium]|nr:FAD-dependent oxidoreductase [Clostridia bacterium]
MSLRTEALRTEALTQPVGAALVVGGGIAGMQASLDLAESGYYVYLVEASPSIGGMMARLDKTFPTNDCSMCILSPKLVECGRHLNIETLTCSEVVDISGEAGHFKVKVKRSPRYIDTSKCTGCGDCEKACPVSLPDENQGGLSTRKAVYRPFPQAYPNAFAIDKAPRGLCQVSCPAGVHAQGYVALIAEGKFKEALALVKKHNPLPAICGRVCHHPCEANCRRGLVDEPIAIASLKRFIADYEYNAGDFCDPTPAPAKGKKVAIIGSGPAGLTCAYDLALMGYSVTVFEALPEPGGMLRVGIPAYRLPKDILATEIHAIERLGVHIKTGCRFGTDFSLTDLKAQGFEAVFLAVGAHKEQKLGIPGENIPGVLSGVDFLRTLNLGGEVRVGKRVVVIGGGNVAIDASRSAIRLGAEEVTVLYRRTMAEMPAAAHEVEEALAEGVKFRFLTAPVEVLAKGGLEDGVKGLRCISMRLGEPDASGRPRPIPIPGSEFELEADTVIAAIGQVPEIPLTESTEDASLVITRRGTIQVDPDTYETLIPGVFAGGDAVTGPATVVEAVAAGKAAAESIRRFLEGIDLREGRSFDRPRAVVGEVPKEKPKTPRTKMPVLPVEERLGTFQEVERGYDEEAARAEAKRCLQCGVCSECLECERVCKARAVDHDMAEEIREIEVGAVILAPGFEPFDPSSLHQYGYGRYKDVVTSVEFERILSASGPYEGHVKRPSDGTTPKRIAFIQCVGSRDEKEGAGYCSSVCCMYSIKEAVIAKEHVGRDLEVTVFYMDMRAYGKDFEKYYERAKNEYGVRFVRAKAYDVKEVSGEDGSKEISVSFAAEDGSVSSQRFDMVVLSVGMKPKAIAADLLTKAGIRVDENGFRVPVGLRAPETSIPGIFASGAFASPKDIPETVMEASASAAAVGEVLAPARFTMYKRREYPPEKDVRNKRPRIGVFICHCGINIGGVVKVDEVVEYAKKLRNVVYAEHNLYTCSQDTQERIKSIIEEYDLNRVVVASCSPRTHEPLFQQTIREAGLNPFLFEMANIRDQCSWVHMGLPGDATVKAKDLVRMAVAKARLLEPLSKTPVGVTQKALVLGGGIAGMTAALGLADQGFPVYLVEREKELGGNLRNLSATIEGIDPRTVLDETVKRVNAHPLITVFTETEAVRVDGFVGNFKSTLRRNSGEGGYEEISVDHGAVIVATGAKESRPLEYLYGQDPRVVTQMDLERMLKDDSLRSVKNVVMIQCVGSREPKRPYCSRVCCTQAVKNALRIKALNPSANIWVLYRDMRTYGLYEEAYRQARESGVVFIRYDTDRKPEVFRAADPEGKTEGTGAGRLWVRVYEPYLGSDVVVDADMVVLAAAIEPPADSDRVAQMLKVPLNEDGFFLEAHVKLRPVDFATDGVFVAGLAHAPKTSKESVTQALAAVGRALTVISKDSIEAGGQISTVLESRCTGCGTCEEVCQFSAIKVNPEKKVAVVEAALCKGCGACAATCRCGAISVKGFTEEEILAEVEAIA